MKRIFITGASGCVGHYVVENLLQCPGYHLFLLVRDQKKLKFSREHPQITVIPGDLQSIADHGDLLKTIHVAILIATAWGGEHTAAINVEANKTLMALLDPQSCEQVIYFSTASILDRHNQPLAQALEFGTEYIQTKAQCFQALPSLAIAPKIRVIFPTLVMGYEPDKPPSQVALGIPQVLKWLNLIRWLKVDGSFHFIHARDLAMVVGYLVAHPQKLPSRSAAILGEDFPPPEALGTIPGDRCFVVGAPPITVNRFIEALCRYRLKRIYFRLNLSPTLTEIIIKLFRIQLSPWDRFCMEYRYFHYDHYVNPETFGLPGHCLTPLDLLRKDHF